MTKVWGLVQKWWGLQTLWCVIVLTFALSHQFLWKFNDTYGFSPRGDKITSNSHTQCFAQKSKIAIAIRTKEPLDESERGEWKSGLKLNVQKTKTVASSPITSWQIEGKKVEAMTGFLFLGIREAQSFCILILLTACLTCPLTPDSSQHTHKPWL